METDVQQTGIAATEKPKRKRLILQLAAVVVLVALAVIVTLLLIGQMGGKRGGFVNAAGRFVIPATAEIKNDYLTEAGKTQVDAVLRRHVEIVNGMEPETYVVSDNFLDNLEIGDTDEIDPKIGKSPFQPVKHIRANLAVVFLHNPVMRDWETSTLYVMLYQKNYDKIRADLLTALEYYYNGADIPDDWWGVVG